MLDTDTLLMKLSIELARKGAGLVSPNPLVGAVLVKDGEVVGEGFHRYDLLKHAEAYAIETAGELARGATLYCSLEPCCHHGRTPPCTDALIEAGIARAVIAIKDPDPRVSGCGIDQLREAGIEVEVGLLSDRALRLNESYFKFITTGIPFVHAVIEFSNGAKNSTAEWRPSNALLEAVSEYDAVIVGRSPRLNAVALENALTRERYRPLVVAAKDPEAEFLRTLRERGEKEVMIVTADPDDPGSDAGGNVVKLEAGIPKGAARSPLGSLLHTLAIRNVNSLLVLPGVFDFSDPSTFGEIDKATLVLPRLLSDNGIPSHWSFGDVEFDLEEPTIARAKRFTELTGYPSVREAA